MTTTLNRLQAPEFKTIDSIDILRAEKKQLANGIPVYCINTGTQELVKIEFLFNAGIWEQSFPLTAVAANAVMIEGTKNYTSAQLADNIDFYGAFLEHEAGEDTADISLYTLNKYLANTLPYVEDVIKHATFSENELDIYIQNKKQRFLVNSQKVNILARRKFSELVLGNDNPYGYRVQLEDYNNLKRQDIIDFYQAKYYAGNCTIIVSGNIDANVMKLLDKHFGGNDWLEQKALLSQKSKPLVKTKEKQHLLAKEDAVQSAIRIGRPLFNKQNEDYQAMQVLNCIFGGYFGSRLMANIREDKGYTYGIGSGIASLKHTGYFFISTEVGVDVCQPALDEIYKELASLREKLVSADELQTVRNYLLGMFLRSTDGAFALADKFKGIYEYGLDYDYYDKFFQVVKNIEPKDIRELANKYLQQDDMIELVVGKK